MRCRAFRESARRVPATAPHKARWRDQSRAARARRRRHCHRNKESSKGAGEEGLVSALILNALAEASGISEQLALPLGPGDNLTTATVEFTPLAEHLHRDAIPFFGILPDGTIASEPPAALLSGSFNPLHAGHTALVETAAALLGRPVAFEVSAVNEWVVE